MDRGVALVTGGGKGIGAACCRMLSAEGFAVAVHYNQSRQHAEELARELPGACALQGDLASTDGIERLIEELARLDRPLSVLVNNAGIVHDNYLFSAGIAEFTETIDTNLRAAWLLTKRLAKGMIRRRSGRIINISSVIGHTGNAGQALYGMSKAALDNLTKCAAAELGAYGILVNSVAPGFIDTDMTKNLPTERKEEILARIPLGRMGTATEVAEVVCFLATKAGYCSGAVFHVNGGMYGG